MRKVGILVGLTAVLGLIFLTFLPTVMGYHQGDVAQLCSSACLASENLAENTGYGPPVLTMTVAGVLLSTLYFKGKRNSGPNKDENKNGLCNYCGKKIDPEWQLCPFCGQSTVMWDR